MELRASASGILSAKPISLWFDLGLGAIRINLAGDGCFSTHSLGFPKFPSHKEGNFIFESRYSFC